MTGSGIHLLTSTAIRAVVLASSLALTATAAAGPHEQAQRIHERLAGIPPDSDVLDSMQARLESGDAAGAAMQAMENPEFYNTTVRRLAAPWTDREFSAYGDLNDATATVIGVIRDDLPFDQVLYEDIVYVGGPEATGVPYAQEDNEHYLDLQSNVVDLSDPANLVRRRQSALPGSTMNASEPAGILTSQGFAEAFLTGRAARSPLSFVTINFICIDPVDAGDDPGFAALQAGTAGARIGTRLPAFDESVSGPDALGGSDLRSFGLALARTRAFSECQVERVFRQVCYREPEGTADLRAVERITDMFEHSNRSMKRVYAHTAAYCLAE
ncbi:MAG: hypothetical protein PVG24_07860 [Gammaproteobacteria bacterium]|jgi:hypothetical protein